MAETLSPNQTKIQKRRPSISTRLQSPTSPFFLGSNDDKLERAQARAARAAAIRRKLVEDAAFPPASSSESSCLDGDQIMELFRNCIKLASENKINQKNTWELKLIDHLSEIIKVEDEDDAETNFQKASCTLEAGVKIYALRVDSVHSEAYKVLGGISRAGLDDQQDTSAEGANENNEQDVNQPRKDSEKKLSPLSTLEPSFESLNVKKLDVAFAVDPLYHQTTAQFDEGGAKGLLLNNLGIYGGCRVLFDSQEVPAKCISTINDTNSSSLVDLSFAGEIIEQMVKNVNSKKDICPTFSSIVEQLDEYNMQQRQFQSIQDSAGDVDGTVDNEGELNGGSEFTRENNAEDGKGCELDDGSYDNAEAWSSDPNGDAYHADDSFDIIDQHMENHYEEQVTSMSGEPNLYDRFENVASLLLVSSEKTSSQNAWAGPEHWKYRKSKSTESVTAQDTELVSAAKRQKTRKASETDIDFAKALDEDVPDILAVPKNLKSLLLPAKKVPCSNKLPEDCHYQPEDLVKLFLLPNVMCLGNRRRMTDNGFWHEGSGFNGAFLARDNESAYSRPDNDNYAHSDIDEQDILISQPHQVSKIEVQYDKTAKQVDVHLLKVTLWDQIHGHVQAPELEVSEDAISFKQVLANFPDDCGAAAANDISPHLCFICLLHLANEHGLRIQGCTNMDDLCIHFPVSSQDTANAGCT